MRAPLPAAVVNHARIAANIAKPPGSAMTAGRWLLAFGFGCLAVVVLTHVAEKLNLLPDSPGHYLDLISAVLGTVLLIGFIGDGRDESQPPLPAALGLSKSK